MVCIFILKVWQQVNIYFHAEWVWAPSINDINTELDLNLPQLVELKVYCIFPAHFEAKKKSGSQFVTQEDFYFGCMLIGECFVSLQIKYGLDLL